MRAARLPILLAVTFAMAAALVPTGASAHLFAPALLEVRQLDETSVAVRWKQPAVRQMGSALQPSLPASCYSQPAESKLEGTGMVSEWLATCPEGLVGQRFEVSGIGGSGADVLLRITLIDGRTLSQVLKADAPFFVVPERQSKSSVAQSYIGLGVEHILGGWDHLLFVLGLVLLVGWGKNLLWTVTAFTVGHSVTLALAVLGFVNVPQAPIEALIALSIYFLAVELVGKIRGKLTLVERAPWIVAAGFGLLHGLGFAGALTEVGLPAEEIPLALFSFNVGIELGQLAFVAVVMLVWTALRALPWSWPKWVAYAPAYLIGCLAAFWFFERVTDAIVPI
ncbi:MAG: HupE/UreJ family protein [Myxococcota bacterium]